MSLKFATVSKVDHLEPQCKKKIKIKKKIEAICCNPNFM